MKTMKCVLLTAFSLCGFAAIQSAADDKGINTEGLIARCARCHGEEGNEAFPGWPPIASMEKAEIIGKLKGHRDGDIFDSTMAKVTFDLTDQQIEAVADYYANLRQEKK